MRLLVVRNTIISILMWACIAQAFRAALAACGVASSFWCVFSIVLIATIFYRELRRPVACSIPKR